mmetsp:Transcript_27796/g.41051  ORF Transcript_27796/g.41051 Transcript_27796/m.41051 type:complete len:91 (-) Transcript_27796:195-467(-)
MYDGQTDRRRPQLQRMSDEDTNPPIVSVLCVFVPPITIMEGLCCASFTLSRWWRWYVTNSSVSHIIVPTTSNTNNGDTMTTFLVLLCFFL